MKEWLKREGIKRKYIGRFLSLCYFCVFLCPIGFALDRDWTITEFHHTAWTVKDGAPSQISALVQTEDGYLWIGSARGLFRFDGVEFESYVPPAGVSLPRHNITSLLATPDGGLWIVFRPFGLGFLKDGQMKVFSRTEELPNGEVFNIACDLDGRIWAGTLTGLALFDGARWHQIGSDWNLTNQRVWSMFTDRDGTFWVATGYTIAFLPRGARSFQQTGIRTIGVPQIAQAKDGRLWMTEWAKPVRTIPVANRGIAANDTEIQVEAYKLLFDRDGSLWMSAESDGIKRVRFPERLEKRRLTRDSIELESFSARDGLTNDTAGEILEDREGNIWVSSSKGLDRFSYSPIASVRLPPPYVNMTLLPVEGGDVLVASIGRNPMLRITRDRIIKVATIGRNLRLSRDRIINEGVPMEIASFYRVSSGTVWWGGLGGIWKQDKDHFKFFHQPIGSEWFWEVFPADESGGLWIQLGDLGLIHFKNGVWTSTEKPKDLPEKTLSASFKDQQGRIWLGYDDGGVCVMNGNEIQSFSRDDGVDIGRIKVIRGRGAQVWLGGETGLAIFNNGRFSTINTAGEPFGAISGIVETADGGLWLNETHGIIYIPPAESQQLLNDPDHRINYRLYNILDGLRGGPQINHTVSTAVEASDGRIWFATDNGLARIDPAKQKINDLPPPVVVKTLTTDEKTYQSTDILELPKGTESLRISYTALSLSVPERVHYKYWLEGFDHDWRDAGTRREASFTNLGPGAYRFRVIASNNDGVWNEEGAALEFKILPMFYQTNWFLALCVAALAFLVWVGHKLRVRQVKALMHLQFQERLAERTRVAQEIHDTFLQTVHGSKMVADHALKERTDHARMVRAMEQLSTWLGQASEEGRSALNSLRASTTERNDLSEAFRRAIDECRTDSPIAVSFSVKGESREMHPVVRDEIYRIGYEAIRNASVHSGGDRLDVSLEYAHDLRLRVSDNGAGIDSDVIENGKDGHFGLRGMRERAERIGSKFTLSSSPVAGTVITLVVPSRIAFRTPAPNWVNHLKSLFHRN